MDDLLTLRARHIAEVVVAKQARSRSAGFRGSVDATMLPLPFPDGDDGT
jgi:hypothetical protein